jgi:hypothetical protein
VCALVGSFLIEAWYRKRKSRNTQVNQPWLNTHRAMQYLCLHFIPEAFKILCLCFR